MAEVVITSKEEAARLTADLFERLVREKPNAVFGVATGSTPEGVYRELAARRAQHLLADFSRVRAFALDEYVGLPVEHPESYHSVIERQWTRPLGLHPEQVAVPPAVITADDNPESYETRIDAAGGIDIQLVGIGSNGHIGFNEPGSSLASRTRLKTLSRQTRIDNARFFGTLDEVPRYCVTQGLGTILEARRIVLLAFGVSKARALANALEGPVTSSVPASVVQFHPHVTALVDDAAASLLANQDYYREAWQERPPSRRILFDGITLTAPPRRRGF